MSTTVTTPIDLPDLDGLEAEPPPPAAIDPPAEKHTQPKRRPPVRRPLRPASRKLAEAPAPAPRNTNGTLTSDSAREAVRARWATETDVQADLEALFRTIPLDEGLALLAKMRGNC